jgi:hypothetical protein
MIDTNFLPAVENPDCKQALKKPSSVISKQQEKEIDVNKTFKRPTGK